MIKKIMLSIVSLLNVLNYANAQVNMQDGSMSYNIPIFSFADGKSGLSTAVNLSYSSGNGLKVNERASNVGQNWNLLAGGFIARQQFGEPDDQNSLGAFPAMTPMGTTRGFAKDIAFRDQNYQSFVYTGDIYSQDYYDNYYPNGYMYSEFPVTLEDQYNYAPGGFLPKSLAVTLRFKNEQDKRFKLGRNALTDREQDIFVFNLNGEIGQFVIGRDGMPTLLNLDKSKYIIEKVTEDLTAQNIRTRIKEFTIKDDKRIVYKFANYELTEVMEYDEIHVEGDDTDFSKRFSGATPKGKFIINKWNLTEITNTNTTEKILFSYNNGTYSISDVVPSYGYTVGQATESVNIVFSSSKGTKKNLSQITLPNNSSVEFLYKTLPRQDVLDDYPIEKIAVKYNNIEQYNFSFDYGYFYNSGSATSIDDLKEYTEVFNDTQKKGLRLYLKSVRKIGDNLAEPPHEFGYYIGSNAANLSPGGKIPPYTSLAQDHWGYYTSNSNISSTNYDPSKEDLKALLTNPAFREPSPGSAALGLLRTIKTPQGGITTYEYEQNQSKDSDNPSITKNAEGIRVFKITKAPSENSSENDKTITQYSYINADGSSSGWGFETPYYNEQKSLEFWNAGNLNGYKYSGRPSQSASGKSFGNAILKSTGSAIKSAGISALLGSGYEYKPIPGLASVTLIHAVALNLFLKGFITRVAVFFNPSSNYTMGTYNFYSPQYQNPIGINYKRVEEKNISIVGGAGKMVYEFTAPTNVRASIPALAVPYAPKARVPNAQYGMLSSSKAYHQNGTLLREIQYQYTNYNTFLVSDNHKSCKIHVNEVESAGAPNWSIGNGVTASNFNWQYYYPQVKNTPLASTVEINYPASGNTSTNTEEISYNAENLVNKIITQKSNYSIVEVRKYYTNDFNNISPAIIALKSKNMLNTEIATEKWITKAGVKYLVEASVNEYAIAPNGEIVLSKIHTLQTAAPIPQTTIGVHNPNLLIRNASYYKEQVMFNYLSNAVLKETKPTFGNTAVQLLDYEDRIPVAAVTNANYDDVAYSSFETNNTGAWQYSNANIVNATAPSTLAVTGSKYFQFGAGIEITKQVTNNNTYVISFWHKGSTLHVSFAGSLLSPAVSYLNVATGWRYHVYNFSGTGLLKISQVNDPILSSIDELRLHPKGAVINTVAYDKFLRKSAECDENGRIQYYEYDGLHRLLVIRDENRNIVKKYCYNESNCIDQVQNEPIWQDVPNFSICEPCALNPNYLSGRRLRFRQDINPASSTHGQQVAYEDVNNPCPSPADYVLTNTVCQVSSTPPYGNTGMVIKSYTDINPCSATYLMGYTSIELDGNACPYCSTPCNGPQYKCINGVCVQGSLQIVKTVRTSRTGPWECMYAYCFPDGTTSEVVNTVLNPTACTVACQ
jgi:YD repeat-containing protein